MVARLESGSEKGSIEERNPDAQARACVTRGCEHERAQNWEAAIQSYHRAIEADPQDLLVRYFANNNLGYSLNQVGRFDEAEEYCEVAIEINPSQYNAHKNLGLARKGQGRWLDAALSFAEAARLCPGDYRAWLHLQKLLADRPSLLGQSEALAQAFNHLASLYRDAGAGSKLN